MKTSYQNYTLNFKFDAGTSRGVLHTKDTYIIKVMGDSDAVYGLGECGPLVNLSIDDRPDLPRQLESILSQLAACDTPSSPRECLHIAEKVVPQEFPAMRFGIETALLDLLYGGKRMVYDNAFYYGEPIPINGLIWMGQKEDMLSQIRTKIEQGFNCIKMKVGSIDFEKECDILRYIRSKYIKEDLILRVDANGAFTAQDAMDKLRILAEFNLHSIEQPVLAGQTELMYQLCQDSPIPIALDEELIGINTLDEKAALLDKIQPPFIILKPTLLGGFRACDEWIEAAEQRGVGWWITSALESNIGLNAISQYTYEKQAKGHQGLGTGQLYHNNFSSPLLIKAGELIYGQEPWHFNGLNL